MGPPGVGQKWSQTNARMFVATSGVTPPAKGVDRTGVPVGVRRAACHLPGMEPYCEPAPGVIDMLRHFISGVVAMPCKPESEPINPGARIAEKLPEGMIERGKVLGETYRRPDPKHVAHRGST